MNTAAIREAAAQLDAARASLQSLYTTLATLELRNGQELPKVTINGVVFDLAFLSRESGWMPQAYTATEAIRTAAIELVKARVAAQKSKVEGAEFVLRRIIKWRQA